MPLGGYRGATKRLAARPILHHLDLNKWYSYG